MLPLHQMMVPIVYSRATRSAPEETTDGLPCEEERIRALYRVLLLRAPEPNGLAAHLQLLRKGRPFEQIVRGIFSLGNSSKPV
jgi:hypothetical protein